MKCSIMFYPLLSGAVSVDVGDYYGKLALSFNRRIGEVALEARGFSYFDMLVTCGRVSSFHDFFICGLVRPAYP